MLVSFVLGMMATALAEDELLLEARLPLLAPDTRFGFYEFSRRAGDYALAMALVTFRLQASRRGSGSAAPRRGRDSPGWMGLRPGGIGFFGWLLSITQRDDHRRIAAAVRRPLPGSG